jgi:hypothetical protein
MPYYPSSCATLVPHYPDPCEEREYGRIRSAGFIRTDYTFTVADPTAWLAGITGGQIIIIPETNGESPKGSPVIGPRYGYHMGAVLGYEFEASYEDPNYNSNCTFYNQLVGNLNYTFFYRTSANVYLTNAPVTIIPNRVVKNDLTEDVVWEVLVRWTSSQFPCGEAIPEGVFDYAPYYYYEAAPKGSPIFGTYTFSDDIYSTGVQLKEPITGIIADDRIAVLPAPPVIIKT